MRSHFIAAAAPVLLALMPLGSTAEPAPETGPVAVPQVCQLNGDSTDAQRHACLEKEWNDYRALQKQLDDPRIQKHKEAEKRMQDAIIKADKDARAALKAGKITQEQFNELALEIQMQAMTAGLSLGMGDLEDGGGCANKYSAMSMVTNSLVKGKAAVVTDRALGILLSAESMAGCFAGVAADPDATPDMIRQAQQGESISLQVAESAEKRWCGTFLKNPDDPAWNPIFGNDADFRKAEAVRCALTLNPAPKAP